MGGLFGYSLVVGALPGLGPSLQLRVGAVAELNKKLMLIVLGEVMKVALLIVPGEATPGGEVYNIRALGVIRVSLQLAA